MGQASEQDLACENGFSNGEDMNVPGAQHPKRPVDGKKLVPLKVSHLPPHSVRVKPLP